MAEKQAGPAGPEEGRGFSSPYGPQHGPADEAAGGADNSPDETTSAGEREGGAVQADWQPPAGNVGH